MKSHSVATVRRVALVSLVICLSLLAGAEQLPGSRTAAQSSAPAPYTMVATAGEQKTLVILVNFQNYPTSQPYTVDSVRNLVFGSVSNYFAESSYRQAWLGGDVYGWFTIPMDNTVCDTYTLSQLANAAAVSAGANLSSYSRYVYVFPGNACGWAGITLKSSNSAPRVFINGSFNFKDVTHELGHSFGLDHSGAYDCGSASIGSTCTAIEYGDKFDEMGTASYHFNAYQKERLGWLNSTANTSPITTVTASGTYFIEPLETLSAGGAKALKILKSVDAVTGDKTWYYVESRQATGFDSALATNTNIINGVLVHQATQFSNSFNLFFSHLLDMTPETSSWLDPALVVGRDFQDSSAGFSMTPIACSSAGCSVLVSFSSQPAQCVNTSPTVTMTPGQPAAVQPGVPVTFTVSVRNNDTAGCANATFNLQPGVPAGWSAALGNAALALSPGASATTPLTIAAPASAVAGSYNVNLSAANSANAAYAGSAAAIFSVAAPPLSLAVTMSTDKASYSANQIVSTRGVVYSGTIPMPGVSVSFTITKANGAVIVMTATTGADGSAIVKYRLNKKDPTGTYQDKAAATVSGVSAGATTSFLVR